MTTSGAPTWSAPVAPDPIDATVAIPGSKSLTNRYLVLAAIADTPSTLRRPLRSRDTLLMAQALEALGVIVEDVDGAWRLTPPLGLTGDVTIDCGLAGTVMRFIPAIAALSVGHVVMDGDPRARERPMSPILRALRDLGVRIDDGGRGGLPFTIGGTGAVRGGTVRVDASASSQFVSGLLLAAARFDDGITVIHTGATLPSLPHIEMTVEVLRSAGVIVDDSRPSTWRVEPGPVEGLDVDVEPDLSNAGPFIAAALVTGGSVRIPGWPTTTTQAGDALRGLLDAMGADVYLDQDGLTVTGTLVAGQGQIHGVEADLHDVGELTPVIAALAALADSPSRLTGIGHLRGHETDRLAALASQINGLGGSVTELDDGLAIEPAPLHGGTWASYADHRMATAGALIGLRVPGIDVDDIATTAKTLPDFPGMWSGMLTGSTDLGSRDR